MKMDWLTGLLIALHYIFYPVYWLLSCLLYILYLIATPFIYIAYLTKEATILPFRFFAQFEALWYFLGAAVVIGLLFAVGCHFILRIFVLVFDLDRKPPPKPIPPTGHDAASYRAARQAKKQNELDMQRAQARKARLYTDKPTITPPLPASAASPVSPGLRRWSLTNEILLEHTDEEEDESVF